MTLEELNALSANNALKTFTACCGATHWAEEMVSRRPFLSNAALLDEAQAVWKSLEKSDWIEAFSHHPKIGDLESLREKFSRSANWSKSEQFTVEQASEEDLRELAEKNLRYEQKFGYIFIVCATGKTAAEMLSILNQRIENTPEIEIELAADEQQKITAIRLQKLLTS